MQQRLLSPHCSDCTSNILLNSKRTSLLCPPKQQVGIWVPECAMFIFKASYHFAGCMQWVWCGPSIGYIVNQFLHYSICAYKLITMACLQESVSANMSCITYHYWLVYSVTFNCMCVDSDQWYSYLKLHDLKCARMSTLLCKYYRNVNSLGNITLCMFLKMNNITFSSFSNVLTFDSLHSGIRKCWRQGYHVQLVATSVQYDIM